MRWQPLVAGVLALALLDVAVSSGKAAGRVGTLLDGLAGVVAHVLSPTVAAIPDLRKKGSTSPSSDTTGTTAQPASTTMPDDWSTSATALYA